MLPQSAGLGRGAAVPADLLPVNVAAIPSARNIVLTSTSHATRQRFTFTARMGDLQCPHMRSHSPCQSAELGRATQCSRSEGMGTPSDASRSPGDQLSGCPATQPTDTRCLGRTLTQLPENAADTRGNSTWGDSQCPRYSNAEKARHDFPRIRCALVAGRLRWTGLNKPEPPYESSIHVSPSDALDCFLRRDPSYERFRDELAQMCQHVKTFSFKREAWNAVGDS